MPIDSALKRRSVAGVARWPRLGVTPNAAAPVAWRASVARSYAGVTPNPPTPGTGVIRDKFSLGQKASFGTGPDPALSGSWGF